MGFESDTHVVEQVFREERARVLAALVRSLGDFELPEDALQEAFAMALERWPSSGTPDSPAAWLLTVARNRAIDRIRRERTLQRKTELLARLERPTPDDEMDEETTIPDERLSLIFACCHPALSVEARLALSVLAAIPSAEVQCVDAGIAGDDRSLLEAGVA